MKSPIPKRNVEKAEIGWNAARIGDDEPPFARFEAPWEPIVPLRGHEVASDRHIDIERMRRRSVEQDGNFAPIR